MSLPNLYCDVDGVINIAKHHDDAVSKFIFRKLPTRAGNLTPVPLRIRWSNYVPTFLSGIEANFYWLTTWNQQAVSILEPLFGIKSVGVLDYKMKLIEARQQKWKYELLKKHQKDNPTPFVWIDDVATKHYKEEDWIGAAAHLVVRPHKNHGITREHILEIGEFLKVHS